MAGQRPGKILPSVNKWKLWCHCFDGGPKARKKIVLISRLAMGHIAHLLLDFFYFFIFYFAIVLMAGRRPGFFFLLIS
jgi:hypothetical protein